MLPNSMSHASERETACRRSVRPVNDLVKGRYVPRRKRKRRIAITADATVATTPESKISVQRIRSDP